MSTVQLANLRRGLQDHLYLTLARQLGLDAAVEEALRAVVPRVFSDAGETVGFAETGDAYEAARLEAGRGHRKRLAEGGSEARGVSRLLAASRQLPGVSCAAEPAAVARPRLFVAERDPFTGLPALKAR